MALRMTWFQMFIVGIITAILGLYLALYIKDKLDTRPFKFEDFENAKELEEYLHNRFPTGSDGGEYLEILKEAGGKCESVSKLDKYFKEALLFSEIGVPCEFIEECKYKPGIFSLNMFKSYRVMIYLNNEKKIIHSWADVYNLPN